MKKILLLVVIFLLVGTGYYFFTSNQQNQTLLIDPAITPLPSSFKVNVDDLKQGGVSYADPNGIFNFLYPLDFKQDIQNDGKQVRIYKIGDTQQGQTEIYDGVVMVFESITLNGQTLDTWIDETIKNATQDGTSQIIEPKKSLSINNYPGYTYKLRGLGEFQTIVLQKEKKSNYGVLISIMVADPQNVGFQKDVDRIVQTVTLQK